MNKKRVKRAMNDGPDEIRMLMKIAQAKKLAHPTDDDEKIIDTKPHPNQDPSSLLVPLDPSTMTSSSSSALPFLKQTLPHWINYLNFKDILKCRLICRVVSEAVDHQLENNFEFYPYRASSSKLPQPSPFINCRLHSSPTGPHIHEGITLLDDQILKKFLTEMEKHPRNPFVGRCVRFGNYGETTHNYEYWENALEVLRKFGEHIWHVELSDGNVAVGDPLIGYRLLRQCLSLLPDLKSLEISFTHDKIIDTKVADALVKHMSKNPLPFLPLEKLDFSSENKVCPLVQDFVVATYSCQLKALASHPKLFYEEINELTFQNLEVLYLTNVETNEILVDLRWCKLPKLKRLYLNLGGERCTNCPNLSNEVWSVKTILLLVKKFQLEFLSIFLAPGCELKGTNLYLPQWNLECLEFLEIQHCNGMSYEFLKCFPNLEHLHIFDILHPGIPERVQKKGGEVQSTTVHLEENSTVKTEVEVNKYLYRRHMYESNVWEHLSKLNVITSKCIWDREGKDLIDVNDCYWRETYEYRKRGKDMGGMISKMMEFLKSIF